MPVPLLFRDCMSLLPQRTHLLWWWMLGANVCKLLEQLACRYGASALSTDHLLSASNVLYDNEPLESTDLSQASCERLLSSSPISLQLHPKFSVSILKSHALTLFWRQFCYFCWDLHNGYDKAVRYHLRSRSPRFWYIPSFFIPSVICGNSLFYNKIFFGFHTLYIMPMLLCLSFKLKLSSFNLNFHIFTLFCGCANVPSSSNFDCVHQVPSGRHGMGIDGAIHYSNQAFTPWDT
jgi:hypothetical protein